MSEPAAPFRCPKCSGEMRPGLALDRGHYNFGGLGEWVVGEARRGGWGGIKLPSGRSYPLRGLRCEGCGFVEFYAVRLPHRT
jgi:hypothetical protein